MHDMDLIYREYAKLVFKFLYVKTHSVQTAEELTQETFYRAVYSLNKYNQKCSISTWLCSIAKHVWQQELEKNAKHPTEELDETFPSQEILIDEQLVSNEQRILLLRALHKIQEPAREILYLRLLGDLSFKEIGAVFGESETWARVTFFRAKKELLKGDVFNE